jgi:ATP-dependent phosphofructokinase / diphosphate-dependent phosphofructokinase
MPRDRQATPEMRGRDDDDAVRQSPTRLPGFAGPGNARQYDRASFLHLAARHHGTMMGARESERDDCDTDGRRRRAGLNPAIRSITIRALREGYRVLGIRRGWGGLVDLDRNAGADNSGNYQVLTEDVVNRAGRTGGTFLHTSRTRPSHLPLAILPPQHQDAYRDEINDLTPEVLRNLEYLGVDYLIPIGGDDTLSYAQRMHEEGVNVVAIPKTMDNDVPGTDYCIGFSTCVTRTIELTHGLRTSAGSHERFLVIEVFGRYAGFTALLPTMAGAADRCIIPEHAFDIEKLAELMVYDRQRHPSRYAVVLVSEGARMQEQEEMSFEGEERDQYGHRKLGGMGDRISVRLQQLSMKYNNGRRVNVVNQRLGYLVRSGDPTPSTPSCRWRSATWPST